MSDNVTNDVMQLFYDDEVLRMQVICWAGKTSEMCDGETVQL